MHINAIQTVAVVYLQWVATVALAKHERVGDVSVARPHFKEAFAAYVLTYASSYFTWDHHGTA